MRRTDPNGDDGHFETRRMSFYHTMRSPLGELKLTSDGERLTGLYFEDHSPRPKPPLTERRDAAPFRVIVQQLDAYFFGDLKRFDIAVALTGTEFQRAVWSALRQIDHGTTRSYAAIAAEIGKPNAIRAAGSAIGRNPISIIVPCHRVLSSRGSLTGFAGGVDRKRWLLQREGVVVEA